MATATPAKLTTYAQFAPTTMPENLAVRGDGSILVVASTLSQLWLAPVPTDGLPVEPVLLHTFGEGELAQSIVEDEPEVSSASRPTG